MTRRRQLKDEQDARLQAAEEASAGVADQGAKIESQLGLVQRLSHGWHRVHEYNHLAELFRAGGGVP